MSYEQGRGPAEPASVVLCLRLLSFVVHYDHGSWIMVRGEDQGDCRHERIYLLPLRFIRIATLGHTLTPSDNS
jgi:hypothetical protein